MALLGTNLSSSYVGHVRDSLSIFGEKSGEFTPIVAKPKKGRFPCVSIPEGVFALKYRQGVLERKPLEPGFHWISPFEEVRYVITKQDVPFDFPIKSVPTRDNVMVSIDVILTFRIHDPILFIELLSPEKLTQMLSAANEEAIRNLANTTYHSEIYDLVKMDETHIVDELRLKFVDYGVTVVGLTITNVQLPKDIANRLQQETIFISRHRLQRKKQEFDILLTKHTQFLEQRRLQYKNERLAYVERAKRERALISKEIDELEGRTEKHIAEIKAETDRIVRQIEKETDIYCSKLDEERTSLLKRMRAEANKARAALLSEAKAYADELYAKTDADIATLRSQITSIFSEVEADIASKLKAKRDFEKSLSHLDVSAELTQNKGDIIVSGNTNGNIVAQLTASSLQREVFQDAFHPKAILGSSS